jgi:thiamine pyrophosphate-dependent acetolactate synthase large subunit-like protein
VSDPSSKSKKKAEGRRRFLKGAAAGAAALVANAKAESAPAAPVPRPSVVPPTQAAALAEMGLATPAQAAAQAGAAPSAAAGVPASDYMVDILKTLDLDYIAVNPGSAFDGLHESLINYGQNKKPEMITCLHEEQAAALSHGYAKAAGKPMMIAVHGTVGLLHASFGIFQAWCDRVPMLVVVGQNRNPTSVINRPHSAQDMGAIARDYTKWDDEATTLDRFAEATVKAYTIGRTPPMGPTLITVDSALQDSRITDRARLRIPALALPAPPQGDSNAVKEAAKLLVNAENPLIMPGKLGRTAKGWDLMVELAELLQAPVFVGTYGSWHDFPNRHKLYGRGGTGYRADVTLGLELNDLAAVARTARTSGGKTISICSEYLSQGRNIHDYGNYSEVDLAIAADGEATLPSLIEEIRRQITPDKRRTFDARGAKIAAAHKEQRIKQVEDARYGWDVSPISIQRMIAELGAQIKNDDWAIGSGYQFTGDWQRVLLNFDKHHRYNGDCGGFGIGYDTQAAVGVALANKGKGRLTVAVVGDGDLNFGPGVLWTAAHHKIPLLFLVHNNRGYQAEVMIVQRMCSSRGRGTDHAHIGTTLNDPDINYKQIAQGYGLYAEGPISNPNDLAPALQRALARVRAGEPALVDVVSQAR